MHAAKLRTWATGIRDRSTKAIDEHAAVAVLFALAFGIAIGLSLRLSLFPWVLDEQAGAFFGTVAGTAVAVAGAAWIANWRSSRDQRVLKQHFVREVKAVEAASNVLLTCISRWLLSGNMLKTPDGIQAASNKFRMAMDVNRRRILAMKPLVTALGPGAVVNFTDLEAAIDDCTGLISTLPDDSQWALIAYGTAAYNHKTELKRLAAVCAEIRQSL